VFAIVESCVRCQPVFQASIAGHRLFGNPVSVCHGKAILANPEFGGSAAARFARRQAHGEVSCLSIRILLPVRQADRPGRNEPLENARSIKQDGPGSRGIASADAL
jgi:hypothetical protein